MTDVPLLSDIIMSAPRFSFFEELIQIPSPESELPNHQVHTINKIVDDIGLYLKELQSIFSQIKMSHVEATVGLEWYYEGKDQIHQLSHNLTNIDSMLTRLLVVLEAAETSKHIEFNHLLNKFEESTDLLLEVKKSMIVIKRKTEISINYKELEETTMWTLNNEIEECLKMFLKLKDLRALSPSTQHKSLSLPEILQRMQTDGSRGLRSVSLPTSSEVDESINTEFGNLESRLEPLKVSINFLPLRIEEFERMSSSWFPEAIATIHQSQTKLMSRWYYFLGDLQQFKKETIDAKWNTIFEFLISRASEIIDGLVIDFEQKANRKISKKIGENYKLCSSTISIVKESVVEKLLNDPEIIHNFNDQLLDKWNLLNDILMRNQKYDDAVNFASSEFTRLKSLQIARTSHSPVRAVSVTSPVKLHLQENDVVPGLGIDLGIDVENSHVPFSIKNSTKVRDFQQRYTIPKSTKPNLLQEFKLSKNTSKEDDEETLVTKTPKLGALTELMESVKLSEHRPSQHEKLPSRIPQIVKNYTQLGLPFVPKKTPVASKIPTIAPSHSVFQSPTRSIFLSPVRSQGSPDYTLLLHCPIHVNKRRANNRSPTPKPRGNDTTNRQASRSSRTSSLNFNLMSPNLNLGLTPNLSFPDSPQHSPASELNSPISYRSTSPDRPTSSLGSRFDDEHLLQPLKHFKPAWK